MNEWKDERMIWWNNEWMNEWMSTCGVYECWDKKEAEEHEEDGDKLPGTSSRQIRFQPGTMEHCFQIKYLGTSHHFHASLFSVFNLIIIRYKVSTSRLATKAFFQDIKYKI